MANEFAQSFSAFSQMGNQALAQSNQALNNTMGLMSMSLRREQMELGRQAMEQRQQELIFEQGKQAANQKMDFYEKALSLSEAMGGAQGTRLRNVVLENISKDLGSPIEGGTVKDDQDYLALYKTTDPRHWGELDAMLRDERGPKESSALIPSLRQQAAIGNIQEAEIPIPQGFRGGINNMASLFRDGFYVDAETGEISGGHTQQAFGIGGSDTPQAMEKLPHETFMQVKDYVAAKDKQGALQRAIQQLGPEAQTKMADLIVKQQSGLPMTSKEEMEVNSYNQALDLMAVENRTPEQDEELDFHLRVNGHLDKMDRPTQMEQARIREIESRREKISHEVEHIKGLVKKVGAQTLSIYNQTEIQDEQRKAHLEVLEHDVELAKGKIAKDKAQTALMKFRLDSLPAITQQDRERHAKFMEDNEARLAILKEQERKLRLQNESFPERDQLEKRVLELSIEAGKAQIEFDRNRTQQNWDKLQMAKEKLPAEIAALDRRHRQLVKEDETLDANKQSIVKKRELDMQLKAGEAEATAKLNKLLPDFILNGGDIADRQQIAKFLKDNDINKSIDQVQEAGGFKPATRMDLTLNPNAPSKVSINRAQETQDKASFALSYLSRLRKNVSPSTVGGVGKLRAFVHGLGQQASAASEQFKADRSKAVQTIQEKGGDIDSSIFFDKNLTNYQMQARIAAFFMADAIADQGGRSLSDQDRKAFEHALGFNDTITGVEQINANIDAAEELLRDKLEIAGNRLGGTPMTGPTSGSSGMEEKSDDELMGILKGLFQ